MCCSTTSGFTPRCLLVLYKVGINLIGDASIYIHVYNTESYHCYYQSMFSFLAVLSDFEDAYNHLDDKVVMREITLVADSLRLGGAILGKFNM